jgi:hypothetical protein
MKSILSMLAIVTSFSALASVCETESRLSWDNDEVIIQYECRNAKTEVCFSKAIWGFDDAQYAVLAGKVETMQGRPSVYAFARAAGNKEGRIFETDQTLGLVSSPAPTIIIDSSKFRSTFVLDKNSGRAKYTQESKKLGLFTKWKTTVSENLVCTKIDNK